MNDTEGAETLAERLARLAEQVNEVLNGDEKVSAAEWSDRLCSVALFMEALLPELTATLALADRLVDPALTADDLVQRAGRLLERSTPGPWHVGTDPRVHTVESAEGHLVAVLPYVYADPDAELVAAAPGLIRSLHDQLVRRVVDS